MKLRYTKIADQHLNALEKDPSKKRILKDVRKALGLMQTNLKHPSLNTHEFKSLKGPNGEKIFEAYAQNETSGAYRIFWYYGPERQTISIIAIIPHP